MPFGNYVSWKVTKKLIGAFWRSKIFHQFLDLNFSGQNVPLNIIEFLKHS